MRWFWAAFTAAVSFGVLYLIANHIMEEESSFDFTVLFSLLGTLFYLPVFLYVIRSSTVQFGVLPVLALVVSGLANTAGTLTSNRGVKAGEVSKVTPLIRTQPVFAAILGFLILSESMGVQKLLGIVATTVGGYVVLLRSDDGLMTPVKQLKTSLPAQLGVISGFLFALGAIADRFAVGSIPPRIYTFLLIASTSLYFLIYISVRDRNRFERIWNSFNRYRPHYLLIGFFAALAYYSVFTAFSLAEASTVVPILQFQVLITVGGGYLFFGESGVVRKLAGSLLLILGVALIAL